VGFVDKYFFIFFFLKFVRNLKMRLHSFLLLSLAASAAAFSPMLMCDSSRSQPSDKASSSSRRDALKAGSFIGLGAAVAPMLMETSATATAAGTAVSGSAETIAAANGANFFRGSAPVFSFVEKGGKMSIDAAEALITVSEEGGAQFLNEVLMKLK
jgi:hypothetical protein